MLARRYRGGEDWCHSGMYILVAVTERLASDTYRQRRTMTVSGLSLQSTSHTRTHTGPFPRQQLDDRSNQSMHQK